jgi:hypothetical protein
MSNFLAIATVTAALKVALENALAADTSGMAHNVTIGRPEEIENDGNAAGVNIYLYQVTPNTAWRNADLPTRNAHGDLVQTPRVAMDLHYLLTFFGNEANLEDQRLMGHVVSALHERPVLTRAMIADATANADFSAFLGDSDLANEIEQVKFSQLSFNLEELSKLWSVFFQIPYRLSLPYAASLVFIDRLPTPARTLPVQTRTVTVVPSVDQGITITPDKLPALQLWLKSDTGVTYDSNGVSLWEDLSGNGNSAEQSATDRRPAFVAHGVEMYPVLHFDGLNDRLAIRNLNYSGPLAGVTVCSMVRSGLAVEQIVLSYDDQHYWELALSDGGDPALAGWRTTDTTASTNTLASPRQLADPRTDTRWHFICAIFDAGSSPDKRFFVDGVEVATAAAHGGAALGGGGVSRFGFVGAGSEADSFDGNAGASGFFAGDIAEIAVYDRPLSDAERDQLDGYFAKRYG